MKKLILPLVFCSTSLMVFAQSTPVSQSPMNKNAVIEELTGINCQFCPDGHKRANQIAADNPGRVVLVNVHAGGYANATPEQFGLVFDLENPLVACINTALATLKDNGTLAKIEATWLSDKTGAPVISL